MNKIIIANDKLTVLEEDSFLKCEYQSHTQDRIVSTLNLKFLKDTNLELDIKESNNNKIDIFVEVLSNVNVNMYECIDGNELKIQYKYNIDKYSNINIIKINNVKTIKEYDVFNLNGKSAKVKRVLKTISNGPAKYDMLVYHNAKNTSSDLINHGVNVDNGKLIFNVSSFISKDMNDSYLNQSNRIINMTNNECKINPNMYIDCYDVTANHSAFIGGFKDDELFYLESRGIPEETATKLLIRGFLTSYLSDNQKEKYNKIIDKYWR